MPLLEEVEDEAAGGSGGKAENLKAAHRRKRAKGRKNKHRTEECSVSYKSVFQVMLQAAVVLGVGLWYRAAAMDRRANSCKMTMSRPDYVHLPVTEYPALGGNSTSEVLGYEYRLVRYMDRKLPSSEKSNPLKPGGTPVLFVPGHLGNFKQARSLGSQAAEARVLKSRRRLDIFAVDFLEEASALHGSLIWRQADFLNHAVSSILALYEGGEEAPQVLSVMIVGHSLGGLVARTAFTLPSYRVGSITDIVTLGTPHDKAPWMMDYSALRLYQCTDSLWRWHSPSPSSTCWSTADKAIAQQSADNPTTDYNKILSDEVDGVPAQNEIVQSVKGVSNQEVLPSAAAKKEACFLAGDGSDTPSEDCPVASESLLTDSASVSVDPGVALGAGWGGTVGLDAAAVLRNTVLVSISGGAEDLMVHPSLCVADGLGLEGQTVDFTTAAMEECGFGVDHLALVWCKQLVGRVVTTLSELERLHGMAVGAQERTKVVYAVLASSTRHLERRDPGHPFFLHEAAGFENAAGNGEPWYLVARSLVTDRAYLVIPAWVCVAGLVLAAALTRGLSTKTAKEGALRPMPALLTPQVHFQWDAVKHVSGSFWTSVRAKGALAVVAFCTICMLLALWVLTDDIAASLPRTVETAFGAVLSGSGGGVVRRIGKLGWSLVDGAMNNVVRALNPFSGAEEALRLKPVKGVICVYCSTVGWMMAFVYFLAVLGAAGNGIRLLLRPIFAFLATPARLLQRRTVGTAVVCVAALAAHVKTFSLPPTFRTLTLRGELSMVFFVLSLALYALLVSLAIFPAKAKTTAATALTHQRLLLLLYAPAPALLMGLQLAAAGVLLDKGGVHEPFVSSEELALASLALLPIIASVWFARRARPFPSPPGIHRFLSELQAQMEEEVTRANGGSIPVKVEPRGSSAADLAAMALERPHGHGACGKCLHADGGHGAVFVETDKERVCIGAGVTLGPGFRVVACDCPRREPAAPSGWCEFCRCVCGVCGGCKDAARALKKSRDFSRGRGPEGGEKTGLSDELGAASAVGLVIVAVLYVGLWAFGMRMMSAPCHCLGALAAIGVAMCGLHWGLARDAKMALKKS